VKLRDCGGYFCGPSVEESDEEPPLTREPDPAVAVEYFKSRIMWSSRFEITLEEEII